MHGLLLRVLRVVLPDRSVTKTSPVARGAEPLFVLAVSIFNFPPNPLPDLTLPADLPVISFFRGLLVDFF